VGKHGGTSEQEQASQGALAEDKSKASKSAQKCEGYLEVKVQRSDNKKAVTAITVQAQVAGKPALEKPSAGKKGMAKFGAVEAGAYDVTVNLTDEQKKAFQEPAASAAAVVIGKTKKLTIKLVPICELRFVLLGYDTTSKQDQPIGTRNWKLTAPTAANGATVADGLITATALLSDSKATLEVTLRDARPAAVADPAVVAAPADYPVKIKPDAWKDKDGEPVLSPAEDDKVEWTFKLSDLKGLDNDKGIKTRLSNMGFKTDKSGVKAYQLLYEDKRDGSGSLKDVKDAVKDRHDKA
jgi:hypothetical protein